MRVFLTERGAGSPLVKPGLDMTGGQRPSAVSDESRSLLCGSQVEDLLFRKARMRREHIRPCCTSTAFTREPS